MTIFIPARMRADQATDAMADAFGRRIDYLRVSVTDRCDYRCVYCMGSTQGFCHEPIC